MRLPKAEETLMRHLWKLEKAFLKDLMDAYPEPKPAKTTLATLLTRLAKKQFVGYEQFGKVRQYFPKVKQRTYFAQHLKGLIGQFFNDSPGEFASFFAENVDLNEAEWQQLRDLADQQLNDKEE